MSTIVPKSESIKNAVKWISEQLKTDPEKAIALLINEVTFKFDLNPNESQFLVNFYKEKKNEQQSDS